MHDAGIVDDDIDSAKAFFRFVEKRGDFRRNGNIGLYGHSPPARGSDFLDDIFGVSGVAGVVDDDSETVRSEAFGDGGANST